MTAGDGWTETTPTTDGTALRVGPWSEKAVTFPIPFTSSVFKIYATEMGNGYQTQAAVVGSADKIRTLTGTMIRRTAYPWYDANGTIIFVIGY